VKVRTEKVLVLKLKVLKLDQFWIFTKLSLPIKEVAHTGWVTENSFLAKVTSCRQKVNWKKRRKIKIIL